MKDLALFSKSGRYFVSTHSGDGKLRVWDVAKGDLKHEYVPNLHLNSPTTSLTWVNAVSLTASPVKNKKRVKENHNNLHLALGTNNGSLALYSLAEGKITCTLKSDVSRKVNALAWSDGAGLFSASSDTIVQWDLSTKSVKCKWKSRKGHISCLGVSEDGGVCVSGSYNLHVWNVKTQALMSTLVGHSADVTNITFLNSQYFLTTSSRERRIAAWSLNSESTDCLVNFTLQETCTSNICAIQEDSSALIAVATKTGALEIFSHQLNGSSGKSVKPTQTIEIAVDKKAAGAVSLMPVSSVHMSRKGRATLAYGFYPLLSFETMSVFPEVKEKRIFLVRQEPQRDNLNNSAPDKVKPVIHEETEYLNSNSILGKRKPGVNDAAMEERLGNLSLDQSKDMVNTTKGSPHSMAHLLIQGLESKDKRILDSVLLRKEPEVLRETVSRLPIQALGPLIKELKTMVQGRTQMSMIAALWLKNVLQVHAAQLLADQSVCGMLSGIQGVVNTRLDTLPPLNGLLGRVSLLLDQIDSPKNKEVVNSEPLLIFQDEDSSDERDSLLGEREGSESEDKWEEFSDLQMESEDAGMSAGD